ncbi:MAG: ABC transporter permease [Lachnospiraceae bacterium]|nr:ABC transporter permease [Lachnospiraceae bacterium]MDD3795173.1 ABC transporter permease [Lachnospiraceae bacterium]
MKKQKNVFYLCISVISVAAVIALWYFLINVMHLKSETVFPGPLKVFYTFLQKLQTKAPDGATLQAHLWASIKVAVLGYGLGALVGVPLGIAMAWNKWVDRFVRPLFDLIRPIPGLAWIPMFILLFGIGITSKALVIFLGSLIACVVNSYTGIRQTKETHLWVGDVFGATSGQKLFRIAIPTALPMIFTGLRVALGTAWTALVAAELLASTKGLGYMIQQARAISRPDIIIVGMLAIGAVGAVFDAVLHLVEIKVAKGMNAK